MGQAVDGALVVGVDGSAEAVEAARWAAVEADHRGRPLRLVHCFPVPAGAAADLIGGVAGLRAIQEDYGQTVVAEAEKAVREKFPALVVESAVVEAAPVRLLVAESRTADLVVVGAHGVGGLGGVLAGSVTEGVALHAHAPTVVTRGRADELWGGPVVLGTDGSAANRDAVAFAYEQAAWRDVELVAVRTWNDVLLGAMGRLPLPVDPDEIDDQEHAALAEEVTEWQRKYPAVRVRQLVVRGRPVRTLTKLGEGAQLLVVGSRGHSGLTGMLLGSTSRALVTYAPCPLAVVRSRDTEETR